MADQSRRIGCGCLPLIVLFVLGSIILGAVEDVTDGAISSEALIGVLVVAGFAVVLAAAVRQRRRSEQQDRDDDGMPSPTDIAPPSSDRPYTPAPPPPPRTSREVRTGPRGLKTEPEDPEAQAFKRRLADAVADLADNVEEMPSPGSGRRPMTSAEMVERAKKRIADFGSNDS